MHISFSAPLRSHTRIYAPVVYSELDKHGTEKIAVESREDFVEMIFSAYVSQVDYEELQNNNIRLEIWTEIPKLNDRNANSGDWGPVVFKDIQRKSSQRSEGESVSNDNEQLTLSLSSDLEEVDLHRGDEAPSNESEVKQLRTSLLVPTSRQRTYGFTYRLVYAAGWIRWLGQNDSNGYIDVVADSGQALFVEKPGWSYNTSGVRSFFIKETGPSSGQICLGHINSVKDLVSTASGIANISGENEKTDTYFDKGIGPSYLLLVIPRLAPQTHIIQKPLIIYTSSKDASITIEPGGDLMLQTVDTEGCAEQIVYDGDRDYLEQVLLRVGYDVVFESTDVLIIAKKDHASVTYRASVLFFSTSMPLGGWSLQLSHNSNNRLKSLFPDSACICFFSVKTSKSVFYDLTSIASANLRLLIGMDGGEFIISPVFNLRADKSLQIAFASPLCSRPRITENSSNLTTLPTPPASPQPYRRKQSKRNKEENSGLETFASIDDVMMTGAKANVGVVDAEERKESGELENIIHIPAPLKQPSTSFSRGTIVTIFILVQFFVLTFLRKLWDIILLLFHPTQSSSDAVQARPKANNEQDWFTHHEQLIDIKEAKTMRETAVERSSIQQQKVAEKNVLANENIQWPHATSNSNSNIADHHTQEKLGLTSESNASSVLKNHVITQTIVVRSGKPDEYILEWEKKSQRRQDFIVRHLGAEPAGLSFYVNVSGKEVEANLKTIAVNDKSTTLYGLESVSELYE